MCKNPHFEVQRLDKNAEDTFEAHFAQLWGHSKPYDDWLNENRDAVSSLKNRFLPELPTSNMQPGRSTAKKKGKGSTRGAGKRSGTKSSSGVQKEKTSARKKKSVVRKKKPNV